MVKTVTPAGFDTASYGEVVELSVPSASGLTLTFVEKGLHVTSIKFKDAKGNEHDIIIGSDDPAHYVDQKAYRHCLIGRYANRLPSETALKLPSGETINLPSHPTQGQNLHGGPAPFGWDDKVLEKVELDKATLFSAKEIEYLKGQSAGIWSLTSPDGEGGHSGTVYCEIALAVLDSTTKGELGQVVLVYRAKLLDKESTALNLTHHWGFNLGASHIAKGQPTSAKDISIADHVLTVNSKEILEVDAETGLVTGNTVSLSKDSAKLKDFRGGKTIGKIGEGYPKTTRELGQGFLGDGYDDFWVFERDPLPAAIKESELDQTNVFDKMNTEEQASFASPESGVSIGFTTNQAGMQAWSGTADVFDGSDARKAIHGGKSVRGQGDGYLNEVSGSAFAMEFHGVYAAWLYPELEAKGWNTILNKGEIYNNWVRMSIRSE